MDDLAGTIATHERILTRLSGKRDGWCAAVEEIRRRSGVAYADGDDMQAESLRALARELMRLPIFLRIREDEQHSADMIERAKSALESATPSA